MTLHNTLFVVDHDPDVRFQVEALIREAGLEVCGKAGLGTEAVSLATELRPDFILCGLKEPIARVVQTIESLTVALPDTPIAVYADSNDISVVRKAMLAGARDFLQAPLIAEEVQRSVTATLESQERRRLQRSGNGALAAEGSIITVFGAKGGIGKTTIATNLAVAMARHAQQSTVLVDADDTFGDAAAALAMLAEQSVADAARALQPGQQDGVKQFLSHHESGLAVLPAPWDPLEWRSVSQDSLQELLRRLSRQYDVVVVDTGSTLSDISLTALSSASTILWVTTPDYASVRDSLQALQAIRGAGIADDRIRVILNLNSPEGDARPQSVETALSLPIFWTIPYDRELRLSTQLGKPIADRDPSRSVACGSLVDLALTLNGQTPNGRKTGIVHRILSGGLLRRRVRQISQKEARA